MGTYVCAECSAEMFLNHWHELVFTSYILSSLYLNKMTHERGLRWCNFWDVLKTINNLNVLSFRRNSILDTGVGWSGSQESSFSTSKQEDHPLPDMMISTCCNEKGENCTFTQSLRNISVWQKQKSINLMGFEVLQRQGKRTKLLKIEDVWNKWYLKIWLVKEIWILEATKIKIN